jgi:hypothetical protein
MGDVTDAESSAMVGRTLLERQHAMAELAARGLLNGRSSGHHGGKYLEDIRDALGPLETAVRPARLPNVLYASPDELRAVLADLGKTLPEREAAEWLAHHYPNWNPPGGLPAPHTGRGDSEPVRDLSRWRTDARVFAAPLDRTWYYPLWQFEDTDALRFVMDTVGQAFHFAPWAMASFLVTQNPFVDAETPLVALLSRDARSIEQVGQAVALFGEHGAA